MELLYVNWTSERSSAQLVLKALTRWHNAISIVELVWIRLLIKLRVICCHDVESGVETLEKVLLEL